MEVKKKERRLSKGGKEKLVKKVGEIETGRLQEFR